MSVAYAENQSMFLDAFARDAAWLGRYARSSEGKLVPWDVIKAHLTATHPYEVGIILMRATICCAICSDCMHVLTVRRPYLAWGCQYMHVHICTSYAQLLDAAAHLLFGQMGFPFSGHLSRTPIWHLLEMRLV